MIRTVTAYTHEIDEPDVAVAEILKQIDLENLAANSVGIVGCNLEYVQNGTLEKLSECLPFDIIGSTTNILGVNGESGEDLLAVIVLTSDDARFSAVYSESLTADAENRIARVYQAAAEKLPEKPRVGIFVSPFIVSLSGDTQVAALNKVSGNASLFGTITLDFTDQIRDPHTIYNGETSTDRMALILISGAIDAHFYFASIPEECFLRQKAMVTASEGNALIEVNNIPAVEYIESLGLTEKGALHEIPSIPLSIDVGDGSPAVARGILALTTDGHVICGGDMPVGATLGVGALDADIVCNSAENMAREMVETSENSSGAFFISCLSRNLALGLEPYAEIETIQDIIDDRFPYLFLYSAGEIYPDSSREGSPSQFHNDSIIAISF